MTPDQIYQAIATALSQAGEQVLEGTLAAVLPILWLLMLELHLARPYMLNVVQKFSLRLGADIWWLAYVAIRDFAILVTFAFSFMFFFPDVMTGKELPVTGPLAALCLLARISRDRATPPERRLRYDPTGVGGVSGSAPEVSAGV